MNSRRPPRPTTWLLNRLISDDAVAGDLIEQYRGGRSRFWFYRQTFFAILVGATRDLRDHKLLAVRAALIASALLFAWTRSTLALYQWVAQWVNALITDQSAALFMNWIIYGGHLHLVWCLGAALVGWIVTRLHRDYPAAAIIAGIVAQLPLAIWWGLPIWLRSSALPSSWAFAHRVIAAAVLVGILLCTLLGGVWGASSGRQPIEARR